MSSKHIQTLLVMLIPSATQRKPCLDSVYIVLGMTSTLQMFSSLWEDMTHYIQTPCWFI